MFLVQVRMRKQPHVKPHPTTTPTLGSLFVRDYYTYVFFNQFYFIKQCPGADPGINYEWRVGVHKSRNIITKGEGGAQEYSTM